MTERSLYPSHTIYPSASISLSISLTDISTYLRSSLAQYTCDGPVDVAAGGVVMLGNMTAFLQFKVGTGRHRPPSFRAYLTLISSENGIL